MTEEVQATETPVLDQEKKVDSQAGSTELKDNQPAEKEDYNNPNWKAFREARKKERLEKEAAEKKLAEREAEIAALKAAFEAALSKTPPTNAYQPTSSYYEEESEDEKIEKKVQAALAKKQKELEEERARYEQQTFPERLRSTYQDFNDVVNEETLDYLEFHYPEIASPLKSLPDGFEKWSHIYRTVKRLIPNASQTRKDAAKADLNMMKPKTAISPNPIPTANNTSSWKEIEKRRAENWARMQKAMKSES